MSYRDMMVKDPAYGHSESNPIPPGYHEVERVSVHLDDPSLARVTRLRLVSDPGFPMLDVSYCHGELKDGTPCRIILPVGQFPKRGFKRALVEMAQSSGVYAKGLGLLDPGVWSVLE